MRSHGRHPSSAIGRRPVRHWPNAARRAVFVAVNLEAFPFAQGPGLPLANPLPGPEVQHSGMRDWGSRVGVWNLLDAREKHDIPAAALTNTATCDLCPEVAAALRARGDEVVGQGRTNAERRSDMDEPTERAAIHACRDRIGAREGAPPRGWMGAWGAETQPAPDLMAKAGFGSVTGWTHDDRPKRPATRSGRDVITVPCSRPTDDIPVPHAGGWPPSAWAETLPDGFEGSLRLWARWLPVLALSLHPFLVGHRFRLRHLRRVLAHVAGARGRIRLGRPGVIAAHARAMA